MGDQSADYGFLRFRSSDAMQPNPFKLERYFARHEFTEGVLLGIELVADALAQHFPPLPTANPNELPDSIDFGRGS